jgi:nitroreductase
MMETFLDLVTKTRTYRRFDQSVAVTEEQLRQLIEVARLTASASNKQPLKYVLGWTPEDRQKIFPTLAWAAQLKEWPGPAEGERPTGFIVILEDTALSGPLASVDVGIVSYTIMLAAAELGLGGCILYSVNRPKLSEALNIPDQYKIALVLALGKPNETVVLETVQDGQTGYWRDANQCHHVPKRTLDELIVKF